MPDAEGVTLEPHGSCLCPTPIKGLGLFVLCAGCGGGNARTPQFLCLPHAHKGARMGGWVGGCQPPPPPGGVGHLSVCGYAKILGGWVPELTPPPPPLGWLSKTLVRVLPWHLQHPTREWSKRPPRYKVFHAREGV